MTVDLKYIEKLCSHKEMHNGENVLPTEIVRDILQGDKYRGKEIRHLKQQSSRWNVCNFIIKDLINVINPISKRNKTFSIKRKRF